MKTYTRKVNYYETDKMQVTHHSNYIRFMEEARVDFLESVGFGYEKLESEGVISPVVSYSCEIKKPTTFADIIEIKTTVSNLTPVRFEISYEMTCRGNLVCTAKSTHCFTDKKGWPISIKKNYPKFYEMLENELAKSK